MDRLEDLDAQPLSLLTRIRGALALPGRPPALIVSRPAFLP